MEQEQVIHRLTVSTLLGVLVGSRSAILAAASSRGTLALGALLVLGGGLSRTYDQEYLGSQPWLLLRGFVVSMVISSVIYLLGVAPGALLRVDREDWGTFARGYLSFLGVYWLLSPMAWLYAIPFERFMGPEMALAMTLITLAWLSVWRVLLITRVISVMFRLSYIATFFVVMLVSEAGAFAGVLLYDGPLAALMGGSQMSPAEELMADTHATVAFFVFLLSPVWLIAGLIAIARMKPDLTSIRYSLPRLIAPSAWAFSIAPLVALGAALPFTQTEQRNREQVDTMLRDGQILEALRYMKAHDRDDFPPHWDPPPRPAFRDEVPTASQLANVLEGEEWNWWGAEMMARKLHRTIEYRRWLFFIPKELDRPLDSSQRPRDSWITLDNSNALKLLADRGDWIDPETRDVMRRLAEDMERELTPSPPSE